MATIAPEAPAEQRFTQGANPILETIERDHDRIAGNSLPDKLVSADSHVTEPPHCYTAYIDPAYRDRAPHVIEEADGGDSFLIPGIKGAIPMGIIAAAGKNPREIKKGETKFADLHRGGWDGTARLLDQDRDGVAAEIIYPSVGMVLCNHPDADYKQAAMWAYNRWLADEFISAAPERLIGVGQTAIRSVAEAVEDFRRFKDMGLRGVMMPGNPATEFDYHDPRFDPLWEASVALNLPISFHILTSNSDGNAVTDAGKASFSQRGPAQVAGSRILGSIKDIVGTFIWGRVFERNPSLRLVCVEADAGWVPHYAYRLDHSYRRHRFWQKTADMARLPSEYMHENVYLTFQDDWPALHMTDMMNPRRLLWANDFPHSDSTWPWSRDLLLSQTYDMDEQEKAWILRDNAAELYQINL